MWVSTVVVSRLQVMMQLDSQGLQAQEAAETARREAGKLGMKVLQQQMQVSRQPQQTHWRPQLQWWQHAHETAVGA